MEKIHENQPEPEVFLALAADAMEEYRQKAGGYASEWHLLDMTFAAGPYRITDPDVRPSVSGGNKWRPKDSEYTYVIDSADKEHFSIKALNKKGRVEYEIRDGMKTPVPVNGGEL